MKFIKQTKMGEEGSLEACIASLTDIKLEDFPTINESGNDFWLKLNNFLRKNYNFYTEPIKIGNRNLYKRGIVIAIGNSKSNTNCKHAVIWDIDKNKLIFDPSPDNRGLKGDPECFIILVKYFS